MFHKQQVRLVCFLVLPKQKPDIQLFGHCQLKMLQVDYSAFHSYKGPAIILSLACLEEYQMDHYNFFVATKTS